LRLLRDAIMRLNPFPLQRLPYAGAALVSSEAGHRKA